MVTDELSALTLQDDSSEGPRDSERTNAVESEVDPYHIPPLWLARRTACIQALRREGIRSVADLGCGHGAVLSLLIQPADYSDDFPGLYPPEPYQASPSSPGAPSSLSAAVHRSTKLDVLRRVPRRDPNENELHLRRVVGVDIDRNSLTHAVKCTAPSTSSLSTGDSQPGPREHPNATTPSLPDQSHLSGTQKGACEPSKVQLAPEKERWEPLTVEIYEGGLEVYNEALQDVEAIIATEVIEHLTPPAFAKFASVILGIYAPRLVVITTPNHEFNPYFAAPDLDNPNDASEAHRIPDPTGRTNRVFRDWDHKFEMTRAEFEDWAATAADEFDYTVTFGGVGSLAGYYHARPDNYATMIPQPPPSLNAHPTLCDFESARSIPADPQRFYATQIAYFRKIIRYEAERSPRSHRPQPLPFFSSPMSGTVALPDVGACGGDSPGRSGGAPAASAPPRGSSGMTAKTSSSTSSRSSAPQSAPTLNRVQTTQTPHRLLKRWEHTPHASAGVAAPPLVLLTELRAVIRRQSRRGFGALSSTPEASGRPRRAVDLHRIWSDESALRELCGGEIGALVDALTEADDEGEFALEVRDENGERAEYALWIVLAGTREEDGDSEEVDDDDRRDPYAEDEHEGYDDSGDDGSHQDYADYDGYDDLEDLSRLERDHEGYLGSDEERQRSGQVMHGDNWNVPSGPGSGAFSAWNGVDSAPVAGSRTGTTTESHPEESTSTTTWSEWMEQ